MHKVTAEFIQPNRITFTREDDGTIVSEVIPPNISDQKYLVRLHNHNEISEHRVNGLGDAITLARTFVELTA